MSTSSPTLQKAALEFKSTSLTVPVLLLMSNNLSHIELQLKEKIAQAPEFFKLSPLLIDLQKLNNQHLDFELPALITLVRNLEFMPIGIRGGSEQQNQAALEMKLPVHSMHGTNAPINNKSEPKTIAVVEVEAAKQPEQNLENKLITQ